MEQNKQFSSSSSKHKIIKKTEDKSKKKKKTVKNGSGNRGRPIVNGCDFQTPFDITGPVKRLFFKYFQNIGLRKGFVFKEASRKRLRNQQSAGKITHVIEWDEKHTWRKGEETEKIVALMDPLNQVFNEEQRNRLIEKLLDISQVVAREGTNEVYFFIINAIKKSSMSEEQMKEECERMMGQFIFLTGKFTNFKISPDIDLEKQNKKIQQELVTLFKGVRQQMEKVVQSCKIY